MNLSALKAGRKWPCRPFRRGEMAMVGAAAALLIFCAPIEPAAARRTELFPWGDLFGTPRLKHHRRVKPQAESVPLPRPRPADAPAPPQGTAAKGTIKGVAEKPPSIPAAQPQPVEPPKSEAAKTNQSAPAPNAEPPKQPLEQPTERATPAPAPQPSACRLALSDEIAIAPSIPDIHGPGDCGGEDLVRLEAVVLPDKRRVTLKPAATLRCKMATEIANWVRADIAPLAAGQGGEVSTLDNYDSYDCRGRNGVSGAKISEHGHANAIDVHGFGFADGRSIVLTDPAVSHELRENVLHSACARFSTVLGPGSDGHHEEHIHLDLIERRNDYRICQWELYDPMPEIAPLLPVARPDAAPPRQADARSETKSEPATSDDAKPNEAKPDPAASGKSDRSKQHQAKPDQAATASTKSGEAHNSAHQPPTKKRRKNRRF
jgi:hypothetical protein